MSARYDANNLRADGRDKFTPSYSNAQEKRLHPALQEIIEETEILCDIKSKARPKA